jgi:excinuclease ABC subunit B
LRFEETEERISQVVYVSATPAEYELDKAKDALVELIVRPTGLIDPLIDVRSAKNQVDDLLEEIINHQKRNERVLVTTLTKRMAEDLTEYYSDLGIRVRYLHSDISTLERMDIIRDLRMGKFDVLVGINLLREGLDIPEVALVAILDADKEGFLRSGRSLIQTCGRAARNAGGRVIMYADTVTRSMKQSIHETNRRREIQQIYNQRHNITPETIRKDITRIFDFGNEQEDTAVDQVAETLGEFKSLDDIDAVIKSLEKEMNQAAKDLEFERAADLRDRIRTLQKLIVLEV